MRMKLEKKKLFKSETLEQKTFVGIKICQFFKVHIEIQIIYITFSLFWHFESVHLIEALAVQYSIAFCSRFRFVRFENILKMILSRKNSDSKFQMEISHMHLQLNTK